MDRKIPWYADFDAYVLAMCLVFAGMWCAERAQAQSVSIGLIQCSIVTNGVPSSCSDLFASGAGGPVIGQAVGAAQVTLGGVPVAEIYTTSGTAYRTPAGWSGPTSPPSTATGSSGYRCAGNYMGSSYCGSSPGTVFPDLISAADASCKSAGWTSATSAASTTNYVCAGTGGGNWAASQSANLSAVTTCPAGYTASGTSCNLSNANQVVKPSDGICSISRVNNTFVNDPQDPDCTGSTACSGSGTGSISCTKNGTSATGTIAGDGSVTLQGRTPSPDGNTRVDTLKAGPPGAGSPVATGTSRSWESGQGSANGGTPAEKPACGSPGQPECDVRIDESGVAAATAGGTQAQADTVAALDAQIAKWNAAKSSGNAASIGVDGLTQFSAPTTTEWNWVSALFPTPSECATFVTSTSRGDITWNLCPLVNYVKPFFAWFFAALTIFYVYASVFRRNEGSAA